MKLLTIDMYPEGHDWKRAITYWVMHSELFLANLQDDIIFLYTHVVQVHAHTLKHAYERVHGKIHCL